MKIYTYLETNFDIIQKSCVFRDDIDVLNYTDAVYEKLKADNVQTSFTIDTTTINLYVGSMYSNNLEIVIECPDDITVDCVNSITFLDKLANALDKITSLINKSFDESDIADIPIGIILYQDDKFYKALERGKDNDIKYEHLMASCLLDKDDMSMIIEEILDEIE
ncbi:MAG: hypothetical protein VZS44_12305 [Bacilli bacterium]|nr:hypothetical protein [Bacilli bacterium]